MPFTLLRLIVGGEEGQIVNFEKKNLSNSFNFYKKMT